jgi:predicted TPR repeat methyltransferase
MVYLSDLAPVLHEVKRVLAPDGLLAFTVETHGGDGVILGERLRYAHSAGYVSASLGDGGLTLSRLEDGWARKEDSTPVPGLVVVATKT